jgi:ATP-binding cassette, subfamily A (ABC1), member 3
MALLPRQIAALTIKNLLIALVRHWFSTPFRAFLLPCIFIGFLYEASFTVAPYFD